MSDYEFSDGLSQAESLAQRIAENEEAMLWGDDDLLYQLAIAHVIVL